MSRLRPGTRGVRWLMCALIVALVFNAGESAFAQVPKPPEGGKPPVKPDDPKKPGDETAPSTLRCRIMRFESVDEAKDKEKDKDVAAFISLRPLAKKLKLLRLAVPKGKDVPFTIAGHKLEEAAWKDFPWKGLISEATWAMVGDDPLSKGREPMRRELRSLTFELFDAAAEIEQIEDGVVVLRAIPLGNRPWPNIEPPADKVPPNQPPKSKEPVVRKLRLKVLEGITRFMNDQGGSADLKDFSVGQRVEATLVPGASTGILVKMQPPGADGKKDETGTDGDQGRTPGGRGGVTPRGPQG